MRKKEKKRRVTILGLCIGFAAILAVCLSLVAQRGTPLFEISRACGLSLDEGEKANVRYVAFVDLFNQGRKDIVMSYEVYYVEEQRDEEGLSITNHYKEARVIVFSNNTTGEFRKSWDYVSGLTKQTIATGDFDGNGKLDIVVGGFVLENADGFPPLETSRVEVLLQRDRGFDRAPFFIIPNFLVSSIVTSDFDADGRIDFVVAGLAVEDESSCHAYVFRNEGAGNFTMSSIALKKEIGVDDMWETDVNADGLPDLIMRTLDFGDETYSLVSLLNEGTDEFKVSELDVPAYSLAIEDFTGDGYPDIICTETDQLDAPVYFVRNERGDFAEPRRIDVQGSGRWLDAMIAGGFSNCGASDVMLLERSARFIGDSGEIETIITGRLLLVQQNTEAELSVIPDQSQKLLQDEGLSSPYAAVAADIDDDGRTDLVIVSGKGGVYLALNQHA